MALSADFSNEQLAVAASLPDAGIQFELGMERRWLVKTHLERAGKTELADLVGLSKMIGLISLIRWLRWAAHVLHKTKKMIQQGTNIAAMHCAGQTFISPVQTDTSPPPVAFFPDVQRHGQRITAARQWIEFMADSLPVLQTATRSLGKGLLSCQARSLSERAQRCLQLRSDCAQAGCIAARGDQRARQLT